MDLKERIMLKRLFFPLALVLAVGFTACDRPEAYEEDVDGPEIQSPGYDDPNPDMPDTLNRDTSSGQ